MDIGFFLKNNGGGQKTREKWLYKNYKEYYELINNWSEKYGFNNLPYKEQIYLCCYKLTEIPKCIECGNNLKFKKSLSEGYPENYCSMKCMNSSEIHKNKCKESMDYVEITKKTKKTFLDKYGVDNIFKRIDLIKESYIKKYGVDHPLKSEEIKLKQKNTIYGKYGDWFLNTKISRDSLHKKYNEITTTIFDNIKIININGDIIECNCSVCNNNYTIKRGILRYRYVNNINPCVLCNPILGERSIKEKDLSSWINEFVNVIRKDRSILNGKEIDIFLPDHNIGIEFNGLYYHSNLFVDNNYHINKSNLANEKGVKLIHIFEDEWVDKKDIIKSIILNYINKTPNKIYARKCKLMEISKEQSLIFLNENHIQGYSISSKNIGLFYNNELVSLMTFGNRKITGKKQMELIRFCNKLNTNVIGGASKLFNYFVKTYKPESIISYQDNRLFNGNLYEKLGFKQIRISEPSYYYVINKKREYRYNWRKDVLVKLGFDSNKTEKEIMEELGYPRIYDCGTKVWEFKV